MFVCVAAVPPASQPASQPTYIYDMKRRIYTNNRNPRVCQWPCIAFWYIIDALIRCSRLLLVPLCVRWWMLLFWFRVIFVFFFFRSLFRGGRTCWCTWSCKTAGTNTGWIVFSANIFGRPFLTETKCWFNFRYELSVSVRQKKKRQIFGIDYRKNMHCQYRCDHNIFKNVTICQR